MVSRISEWRPAIEGEPSALDHMLTDDGSLDRPKEMAEELQRQLSRFKPAHAVSQMHSYGHKPDCRVGEQCLPDTDAGLTIS